MAIALTRVSTDIEPPATVTLDPGYVWLSLFGTDFETGEDYTYAFAVKPSEQTPCSINDVIEGAWGAETNSHGECHPT